MLLAGGARDLGEGAGGLAEYKKAFGAEYYSFWVGGCYAVVRG